MASRPTSLLTGIGAHEYANEIGLVAHNSYIHAYVELGLFGGTLFLATWVWAARWSRAVRPGPAMARVRPFTAAMLAAYAAGIFTLSRCYIEPTYLVLGVVSSYCRLADTQGAGEAWTFPLWAKQTLWTGLIGFAVLKLITQ